MPLTLASDAITFTDSTSLSSGIIGTAQLSAGAVTTTAIASGAITPEKLSQPYTLATAQASTSGTSIDFTGIPSWAKRITVMLSGVSTNGGSLLLVQVGSGSFTTSGYVSYAGYAGTTNAASAATSTSGHLIDTGGAAGNADYLRTGHVSITNISGNSWLFSHAIGLNSSAAYFFLGGGGSVSLSGALDRVRITTVNGTDTFDAGTINISYEG